MKIGILLLILLLANIGYCQSQEEFTTTVTYIEGDVEVFKDGRWMKALLGMELSSGEKIRTGLLSKAELTSREDESVIKLQENTIFEIKRLVKDRRRETVVSEFKLLIGRIWTRVKRITVFGSRFEITTPTAVMGIRGTIFWARVERDGITYCGVEEGWVYFRGINQPVEKEIILREGQSARSSADGMSVTEPEEIIDEIYKEWMKDFGAGIRVSYQLSTFNPYTSKVPKITFIFLSTTGKDIFPIKLGVDGLEYEVFSSSWVYTPPYLHPGINQILVEVKTEFPTILSIPTPYYDPFPPTIQRISEEITSDYRLRLILNVYDEHSGIQMIRADGRNLSKISDGEYEWVSTQEYWKVDEVRIEVEDRAGNKVKEVFYPATRDLPPPPPYVKKGKE